ncbi:DUF4315 family protein [Lachnospiraceae bacterium NSJ-143]|nr:DUF4315 family protein [Lachnospiraceae bacterium NSJ-143]
MNKKIEKVCAEIDKTKAKISEYNARLRELEKQKTELENTEIVELVRGVEASPAELAAFIKAFRDKSGTPVSLGKEEPEHEETDND